MGSIYAEKVRGIANPTCWIAKYWNGRKKGNELTKAAFTLLKEAPINFVGM